MSSSSSDLEETFVSSDTDMVVQTQPESASASASTENGGTAESLNQKLTNAVSSDDSVRLRSLLNTRKRKGLGVTKCTTALLLKAARDHATGSVDVLLEFGADVNWQDGRGDTALTVACRAGNRRVAGQLLKGGATICCRNVNGYTSLDEAVTDNRRDLVDMLVAFLRPRVHAMQVDDVSREEHVDYVMYTALYHAAFAGHVTLIDILVEAGGSVYDNLDDDMGTALHAACMGGHVNAVEKLIGYGADIESLRHYHLQTPLMRAAEYGHVDVAKVLIGHRVNVNRSTAECSCALILACHFGHPDMVEMLLERGATSNVRNTWGYSPLYMAADNPIILKRLLLDKQPTLDALCGERGEAAIHLAAVVGNIECIQLLLEAGADIDNKTQFGETSLWLGAWRGHVDVCRFLLRRNCKMTDATDGCKVYAWDYTPFDIAIGLGHFNIAQVMWHAGCVTPKRGSHAYIELDGRLILLHVRPEVLDLLKGEQDMLEWFHHVTTNPRSLMNLSRLRIREILGTSLIKTVNQLMLPARLVSELMFEDL